MLPIKRNIIKIRIDRKIWKDTLKKIGNDEKYDDTETIVKILKQNQKYKEIIKSFQKQSIISLKLNEKSKSETDKLKSELLLFKDEQKKIDEKKIVFENLKKRYNKLNSDYENLKSMYKKLIDNPIIKKKEVYKEDNRHIKKLTDKNEKLQKKLWEKLEIIEKLNSELKSLKVKLNNIEDWKRKKYGIIVKIKPNENKENDFIFNTEFINSSEYNMWLRDQNEFLQSKNIDDPFHIINISEDIF